MNLKAKLGLLVAGAVVISLGVYFLGGDKAPEISRANGDKPAQFSSSTSDTRTHDEHGEEKAAGTHHNHTDRAQSVTPVAMDLTERDQFIKESLEKLKEQERESVLFFSDIMSEVATSEISVEQIVERLVAKKVEPYKLRDENPYTGSMEVVRTKKTLPGTRYFHAQFFADDEGKQFVQHMSFEFHPGENSFNGVKAAIMKMFNITGAPKNERDGFVSWSQGPYHIWINVQREEDMTNDPFNAYDKKKDVGTIRAAIELEIHDHAEPVFHAPIEEE